MSRVSRILDVFLALLPLLAATSIVSGAVGAGSGIALLVHLREVLSRSPEVARRLSGRLSRHLSGGGWRKVLTPRRVLNSVVTLAALRGAAFGHRALSASLALTRTCDEELDQELRERVDKINFPLWGTGLPIDPEPGAWRGYLFTHLSAEENLAQIHGILGIVTRGKELMTLEQLTEGVRRVLMLKYNTLLQVTDRYWNNEQAAVIARSLADACGLRNIEEYGGIDECTGNMDFIKRLPWPTPGWMQSAQRLSIAALRPLFLTCWSWESRWVQTPFGKLHVYDSLPQLDRGGASAREPPLLLQHGLFVTGWSMALLAWLLARRGRRVVVPDLFDFDHGLSASEGAKAGGIPLRHVSDHVRCLTCVLRELLAEDGAVGQVDLAGHSFGGFLVGELASKCERDGLPVRKVVLLGPGGPPALINGSPSVTRFFSDPMGVIEANKPRWLPAAPLKYAAKCGLGVVLNPNACNTVFGLQYFEYWGSPRFSSTRPTLLLWGDDDNVATPRQQPDLAECMTARFPNIEAFWVRGAGHNLQVDSVVSVARVLDAWLRHGVAEAHPNGDLVERLFLPTKRVLEPMTFGAQHGVAGSSQGTAALQSKL